MKVRNRDGTADYFSLLLVKSVSADRGSGTVHYFSLIPLTIQFSNIKELRQKGQQLLIRFVVAAVQLLCLADFQDQFMDVPRIHLILR